MKSVWSVVTAIILLASASAYAQPKENTPPSQVNWNDELRQAREENLALRNIMSAIESIDTARQNELVQWIVTDRSIRSRVISALRKAGKNISPSTNADLLITQKPATITSGELNTEVELLRIVIESVGIYGTPTIKKILGEDLYYKINSRTGYEMTMTSEEPAQNLVQYANVTAAMWGGSIIFKSGFGLSVDLGNDRIGYPFWLPGNVGVSGLIKKEMTDVRLGIHFQLGDAGLDPFVLSGGFRIKERKLEGTQAFSGEIRQVIDIIDNPKKLGQISVGADIYNAFKPNYNTLSKRRDYEAFQTIARNPMEKRDSLYYLDLSTHAFVTYSFGESLKGLYVSAGAGMHRLKAVTVGAKIPPQEGPNQELTEATFDDDEKPSYIDPLLKVGYAYRDNSGEQWGVSVQYCNTLMSEAFIRIFSWLNLQAKYSIVVGRDLRKWEWNDYIIISPVLKLNF